MPLRDYTCRSCSTRFEALVKNGESAACPSCGGAELERHLSAFARPAAEGGPMQAAPVACGSCGDPRGPGACAWEN